jgi:hypothetical protein
MACHFYLESLGMQQGADEILNGLQTPSALPCLTEPEAVTLKKIMKILSNMQVLSIEKYIATFVVLGLHHWHQKTDCLRGIKRTILDERCPCATQRA